VVLPAARRRRAGNRRGRDHVLQSAGGVCGGGQASDPARGVRLRHRRLRADGRPGGTTHRYPATSTITATSDPCGVRLRWDVLDGRYSTWRLCIGRDGWEQRVRDERHTFFGIGDQTTYTCRHTLFRPARDEPGTTFPVSCTTGEATERGRGQVVARESCKAGGTALECAHVRTTTTFGGGTTGSATFDFWLARETGLPVAIRMVSRTTNGSLIGDVHYEEDVSLRLTSSTPRR
jgi:hypothetical protein